MSQDKPLVNRVAQSGIITLNLEEYYPKGEIITFDLKAYLFRELILREKDFREALKNIDWSSYEGKHLAVFCSTDAIIPMWAYQLVAIYATPFAASIFQGTTDEFLRHYYYKTLATLNPSDFEGKRIVIKGCSNKPVPAAAYMELASRLQPVARSIMYGEPCSTVPLYKAPRGKK